MEGVFLALSNYYYSGSAGGSRSLNIGGAVTARVDADNFLTLPNAIWMTPADVLAGELSGSF